MRVIAFVGLLSACGRLGFGTLDASAPDASCPTSAILCDDFETGDATKWSGRHANGATVVVDAQRAHSGTFALDALVPPMPFSGSEGDLFFTSAVQSTGMLAVREWVSSPQPFVHYDGVLFFTNPTTSQYTQLVANDINQWTVSEYSSAAGLSDHASSVVVPELDTWTCIELDYTFTTGGAIIEQYVNDVRAVTATSSDPSPAYGIVSVGVTRADAAGYHVYVDDVVIARAHIGC